MAQHPDAIAPRTLQALLRSDGELATCGSGRFRATLRSYFHASVAASLYRVTLSPHLGLSVTDLAAVTWRVVWPRWKLVGKLLLHPLLYFGLALVIGHWSVPVAWLHQGLGLIAHVQFSQKHGFTWYAVKDPGRYVALSRASMGEWAQGLRRDG